MNGSRNTVVLRVFNMTREAFSPEAVDVELIGAQNASLLNNTQSNGWQCIMEL